MPAQPAWFHRLAAILADLRAIESTHLDRLAVEKLFRVRQRRARQIMAGLEGLRVGNAAGVSREALIARLERTARRGRIPAAADVRERLLEDLSAGIRLHRSTDP